MIDIDRFKVLNDTHGHATGDEVLRAVGGAIVAAVREDDVPARYGGEEFVVLLRNPSPDDRVEVGERVRTSVGGLDLHRLGVRRGERVGRRGRRRRADQPIDDLIAEADRALYRAKRGGRDRVVACLMPDAGRPRPAPAARRRRPRRSDPAARRATIGRVTDDPADLTNGDLARIFHEIGDMLELKGELVFKTVAYHRAADAIGRSPVDIVSAYRAGTPPQIPGVGKAISDKLAELATTGHLAFYDRLRAEVPPIAGRAAADPGARAQDRPPAPRGARHRDRRRPAAGRRVGPAADRPRHVGEDRGARPRGDRQARRPVRPDAPRPGRGASPTRSSTRCRRTAGVRSIEPAGSFRRRREIDRRPRPAGRDRPSRPALIDAFTSFGLVDSVINRGGYKAAVRLMRGPQVDLMVMPPGEAGTYRIHFTGSKEHNVRLRAMARDRGWSLSEKGFLRIGEDGEPLTGDAAELRTFATEAEAYAFLGLPFIEPELREDAGEIEAALAGRLPALITQADLRGDLHSHSDWSDGHQPIEVMAEAVRRRGYAYQVLTDHTQSLAIARGLTPDRVAEQADDHRRAQRPVRRRGGRRDRAARRRRPRASACSTAASSRSAPTARSTTRTTCWPASTSSSRRSMSSRRQTRAELTRRTLNAIRSPHVDVIAHPSGRKIGSRDDLDLDWDAIYAEAARTGTALEMNGSPPRLDLAVERARRAVGLGCVLAIDSDAHDIDELDYVRWGISQARRAWVTPDVVVNTRSRADLLAWAAGKPGRA